MDFQKTMDLYALGLLALTASALMLQITFDPTPNAGDFVKTYAAIISRGLYYVGMTVVLFASYRFVYRAVKELLEEYRTGRSD